MGLFSGTNERRTLMYGLGSAQLAQQQAEALRQQGQASAIGAIDAGEPKALDELSTGYGKARDAYGSAAALFAPYAETGTKAFNAAADAAGANGQEGNDSATAAFRASPGYEYRVNQATDAVARKASAMGMLGSGNTAAAIATRAGNEADQEFSSYYDRLNGLGQMGYAATGQQAALTKGQGDLDAAEGTARSGIVDANAKARAGVYSGLTQAGMNNIQNTTNAITGLTSIYMNHADDASRNTWSMGLGLLNAGTNLARLGWGGGR